MIEKLTEKMREEVYDYALEIGFIKQVKSFSELETTKEKLQRIKTLIHMGLRIELFGIRAEVINVLKKPITNKERVETLEAYEWIMGSK